MLKSLNYEKVMPHFCSSCQIDCRGHAWSIFLAASSVQDLQAQINKAEFALGDEHVPS
jgi:hypothetical protein